ncbi:MAG: hypothetical protein EOO21_00230 [Comamonadaceae bacterium]|nr:MAG: hypothetical protein EOO21_00230 [Comamonadaceae bacterium]
MVTADAAGFNAAAGNASAAAGDGDGASGGTSAAGGTTGGATAAAGDDGSGVGSGGTGVSATAAVGIGSVDGLGSVIVNGVRYDTDSAQFIVQDTSELLLGMSVKVSGTVNSDPKTGAATRVESAADMRGPVSTVDLAGGTFTLLGTTVSTDPETVWADSGGLSGIASGSTVQVWGLPAAPGMLRATRVAQVAPSAAPVVTGTVQNLDVASRVFSLGQLQVRYSATTPLADGIVVRVRAGGWDGTSVLNASTIENWYAVPQVSGTRVDLNGLITNYAGLATFRVLGTPVDATGVQITGGQGANVGNGVKVEVGGFLVDGVVRATKLKIRHIPGTGGPSSFTLIGPVSAFAGPASFRVRGQPIDASRPGVVFGNGSAAVLGNGARVTVAGSQVLNGVLLADTVTFD